MDKMAKICMDNTAEVCTDNRYPVIERYRQALEDATNIKSSPDEMAVIDSVLMRFWQMGWLADEGLPNVTYLCGEFDGAIHKLEAQGKDLMELRKLYEMAYKDATDAAAENQRLRKLIVDMLLRQEEERL